MRNDGPPGGGRRRLAWTALLCLVLPAATAAADLRIDASTLHALPAGADRHPGVTVLPDRAERYFSTSLL